MSGFPRRHHVGSQHGPPPPHAVGGWQEGAVWGAPPAGAGQPGALRPRGVCAGPPGLQLWTPLLGGERTSREVTHLLILIKVMRRPCFKWNLKVENGE